MQNFIPEYTTTEEKAVTGTPATPWSPSTFLHWNKTECQGEAQGLHDTNGKVLGLPRRKCWWKQRDWEGRGGLALQSWITLCSHGVAGSGRCMATLAVTGRFGGCAQAHVVLSFKLRGTKEGEGDSPAHWASPTECACLALTLLQSWPVRRGGDAWGAWESWVWQVALKKNKSERCSTGSSGCRMCRIHRNGDRLSIKGFLKQVLGTGWCPGFCP